MIVKPQIEEMIRQIEAFRGTNAGKYIMGVIGDNIRALRVRGGMPCGAEGLPQRNWDNGFLSACESFEGFEFALKPLREAAEVEAKSDPTKPPVDLLGSVG
jgi:hypothetical protein